MGPSYPPLPGAHLVAIWCSGCQSWDCTATACGPQTVCCQPCIRTWTSDNTRPLVTELTAKRRAAMEQRREHNHPESEERLLEARPQPRRSRAKPP